MLVTQGSMRIITRVKSFTFAGETDEEKDAIINDWINDNLDNHNTVTNEVNDIRFNEGGTRAYIIWRNFIINTEYTPEQMEVKFPDENTNNNNAN